MRVIKTEKKPEAIPDYYAFYLKWLKFAKKRECSQSYQEAYRFARLAEEFGLAIIEDDETQENLL